MKLHLGCGERYFEEYQNIDYPLTNHSVQKKSIADKHADITSLRYKKNSIDEIRLHHVYEHFTRAQAIALILSWRSWLKIGGILRIEVPDFNRCALSILNPFSSKNSKSVALRHIFGSQEKFWAIHFEGYSMKRLSNLLENTDFTIISKKKTQHLGTYNIEVIASKNSEISTKKKSKKIATKYLEKYLVDLSKTEKTLLQIWLKEFKNQLDKTWAK